ncbi:MAG: hypothetical protein CO186_00690 [Zetaproteobacteria bacterium CG_4_9_14_3_um_filter_49_83]|nr:MAG: hypothetical protein AUJ56_11525 [Zetaproteobacteria bacterium CG1_02_49_23]PIQ31808.1 MAG: hypothetical protein COW62_08810 [Zetaproteobacteria bacterium CG17_big_fil_post_rev_8_21_14_2_50_50_13]PIV30270.1 MAG: hypothetical protein COS35_07625 [Zetaproteobacteria bacterium CG02_land_8_20_14_3_00_50_9]PIY56171.1 MAG: hypothetical protein COZ00_05650 [Zetaproteobacteria bacterium CG_4_10_14_0_8_um_filter_49_80]PJA36449.1 MAG: hypothetical protein CO186_00690 [Zetaproteobacteria bacterium
MNTRTKAFPRNMLNKYKLKPCRDNPMIHFLKTAGILLWLLMATQAFAAETCSYNTYTWNTQQKKAVQLQKVIHAYADITTDERDAITGCTVCIEDQVLITLPAIKPFYMCNVFASKVQNMLETFIRSGEQIEEVTGYRVGKTRGDTDIYGNRTQFSNHSYGIAIDINPKHNGLYDQCIEFTDDCRLIRGGPWQPGQDPKSMQINGQIVSTFKDHGYLWGGEIKGQQKDFMHFSITGY